jgi:hypothetical protein
MPLILHIDTTRWRDHLRSTWNPTVVPVAKGNGYGVGRPHLFAESRALGATTVAVGTYNEVPADAGVDACVMSPWRPFLEVPQGRNVIHTVSRLADLVSIPAGSRVVVEVQTSMRRHGIGARELRHAMLLNALDRVGSRAGRCTSRWAPAARRRTCARPRSWPAPHTWSGPVRSGCPRPGPEAHRHRCRRPAPDGHGPVAR